MTNETLLIWAGPGGEIHGSRLPWPARVVWVPPELAKSTALRVDGLRDLLGEQGLSLDDFGAVYLGAVGRGVALVEALLSDPECRPAGVLLGDPPNLTRFDRVARVLRDAARGYGRAAVVSAPPHAAAVWCEFPQLRRVADGVSVCRGFTWAKVASSDELPGAIRARIGDLFAPVARGVSAA